MSADTDTAIIGKAMDAERKARHAKWHETNMQYLYDNSPWEFEFNDTAVFFRVRGKPRADFYPHTGRWRAKNKTYRGGAQAFIAWYVYQ